MTKVLQKVANQPEGKDEIIDDTIVAIWHTKNMSKYIWFLRELFVF